jgi:hypothetical protein
MRVRKLRGWACLILWASIALCAWGQSSARKKPAKKKTAATAVAKKSGGKTASKSGTAGKSAPQKSAGKSSAKKSGSASSARKGASSKSGSKTASKSSRRGKKSAPSVTWRNRQTAPTPDRYKEIQDALVAKGYLNSEDANGQWGQSSVAALKSFQAAQNIESTGKINSLSLIALGLGPKRETPPPEKPPEPAASKPAETSAPATPPIQP